MTQRIKIKDLFEKQPIGEEITVMGWVRTKRGSKNVAFIALNDGSTIKNIQIVIELNTNNESLVDKATTGAAIAVNGKVVASQGSGQAIEINCTTLEILGEANPEDYPLQPKKHSLEFLREIAHLRYRTNTFSAVGRIRHAMTFAIHKFFNDKGFYNIHTPLITGTDGEGAGEMFRVVTTEGEEIKLGDDEFFGDPTYLTVSGQLEGETFACALSNIYTFGPTFRAENSHTSRHASEFWMIEPEIAFCDLNQDMDLAEEMLKFLVSDVLESCAEDLQFFDRFIDKGLIERLEWVRDREFERVSYTEAVELLQKSGQTFEYPVEYGANLQSEHERYLTETHFQCPTTVYNYPKEIKPFYMRRNDDGKTVAAMDLLVPGIGEIVGGSQREERLAILRENMKEHDLNEDDYWWYVDLRRYGSVPHAGFGLGFERLLMFVTGVANIRDVIPFPRTPGSADF